MKSFTLTALFFVLVALLATPSFGDYIEARADGQSIGALAARDPAPRRGRGSGNDDGNSNNSTSTTTAQSTATQTGAGSTSTNFAPLNVANLASAGIMAVVAGAAAMY